MSRRGCTEGQAQIHKACSETKNGVYAITDTRVLIQMKLLAILT